MVGPATVPQNKILTKSELIRGLKTRRTVRFSVAALLVQRFDDICHVIVGPFIKRFDHALRSCVVVIPELECTSSLLRHLYSR